MDDADGLHCPLDPGAPETGSYLGRAYSDMDMAFYAGMGFDGYRLALQTPRLVSMADKSIEFDGCYLLSASDELRQELDRFDVTGEIPKDYYYQTYGKTLTALFETINQVDNAVATGACDEQMLERATAGCLIVMCGGHQGCMTHPTPADKFQAQMESLIIFNHARDVLTGRTSLDSSFVSEMRIVA